MKITTTNREAIRGVELWIGYALVLSLITIACMLTAEHVETESRKAEALEASKRAEQVEAVKAYISDAEAEEITREQTEGRIREERRIKAEQEEQARKEAEEAEYQAYLASLYTPSYITSTYADTPNGTLTKSGGVNYYNGRRETWYSSNQLYHKDTANWTVGSDGVYRDSDGYVVVASSDHKKGTKVETSLGTGKVYDSGCASGTTDIYTKW